MLNRRGLTLIELLVSVVLIGIVGLATMAVVRSMMNTTTAQVQVAAAQGNSRVGIVALPQELREIGYDTVMAAGGLATSDLEVIRPHRLTIRAMRGLGITCGTPTDLEYRIRKPIIGARNPLLTDGFLLFLDNTADIGTDDEWIAMTVQSIDYNSTCGADPAIAFTLTAIPVWHGVNMQVATQHKVGGPIRWYERVEYGPAFDANGQAFVGVRSLSLGDASLTPIIGPLPDTLAFAFTYYDRLGNVLDPLIAAPIDVQSMGLSLKTVSNQSVSMAGSTRRAVARDSVQTRIALRNAVRP